MTGWHPSPVMDTRGVCIHTYIHLFVCIYVLCLYVRMYVLMCVCTYVFMCVCVYVCVCVCVCMYVCMYVCVRVCMCMYRWPSTSVHPVLLCILHSHPQPASRTPNSEFRAHLTNKHFELSNSYAVKPNPELSFVFTKC